MVVNAPSTASGCFDQLYDDFGYPCPRYQPNRGSSNQGTWHDSVDYGGFGGVTTPGVVPGGCSPTGSVSPSRKWANGVQRTSRGGGVAAQDDHAVRVIRNALRAVAAPAAAAAVSSGVQALIDAANTAAPINLGTLNSGDSSDRSFVPSEVDQGPRLGGVIPAQGKLTNGCQLGGYQRLGYSSGDVSRGAQIWSGCDAGPQGHATPGAPPKVDAVEVTVTWKPGMPKSQFGLKAAALQRHSDNGDLYKAPNPVVRDRSNTRKYKSDLIGRVYDQFNKVNPEFSDKLINRIRRK